MAINIEALLAGGRNQTFDFKDKLPTPELVARLISAFANTDGGIMLLGISESGQINGISPDLFIRLHNNALSKVTGVVKADKSIINIDEKSIGVIQVEKSAAIVGTSEGYFIRLGDANQSIGAKELSSRATNSENSNQAIDSLAQTVAKQTEELGKLRTFVKKANSWKIKAIYVLLGVVAAALVKAAFGILGI